jgi:cysteine desulfurase family protein
MIYLDNASTSFPKPNTVTDAMVSVVRDIGANPGRGGYVAGRTADRLVYETRKRAAAFFNATDPTRVIFTPGCTYSLNIALKGLLEPGDHLVAGSRQHNAVSRPLAALGCDVSYFEWDGASPIPNLKPMINSKTKAVILNHASNVDGLLLPLDEIREMVQGIPLIVDCAQTAGLVDISLEEYDILCATGHKGLLGIGGTGLLIVGSKVDLKPLISGGTGSFSEDVEMPKPLPDRLEPGSMNLAGIAALNAGLREVERVGMGNIFEHEMKLAQIAFDALSKLKGVSLYWPKNTANRIPLFSFRAEGLGTAEIADRLDADFDIACRAGLHCAPQAHKELGTFPEGTIRFAPGLYTTSEDVDAFISAMSQILL